MLIWKPYIPRFRLDHLSDFVAALLCLPGGFVGGDLIFQGGREQRPPEEGDHHWRPLILL